MAEGINSVGNSVPQHTDRYTRPDEEFSMDNQGQTIQQRAAQSGGPGPAAILSLSPDAVKALKTYREKGNKIALQDHP